MAYIGPNKIKSHKDIKGEIPLVEVTYDNGNVEQLSKLTFDEVVSEEACDLTELRRRRVSPAVNEFLTIIRNRGLKINEMDYMDAMLKTSLEEFARHAQCMLWKDYMPQPHDPGEVDFVTIDRILRTEKKTLKDVIKDVINE